ncbi:unnamed protein product [Caenorhabditis brenneri]
MSFNNSMDTREIVSTCSFYLGCGNDVKKVLNKLANLEIPLDILNDFKIKEKVTKYLECPFTGVPQLAATVIQKIEKLEEKEKTTRPPAPVFTFCFLQKRSRGSEQFGGFGGQQPSAKREWTKDVIARDQRETSLWTVKLYKSLQLQ